MGTHACTRIQKDGDFIEMHNRWDGFADEIKKDLKIGLDKWQLFIDYTQNKLDEKKLDLPDLQNWVNNMRQWVKDSKENPTVESTASLLCSQSFNHHHVLPAWTPSTDDTLSYWGYNSPDVIMTLGNESPFLKKHKISETKVKDKPVTDDYFLVRIVDVKNKDDKITQDNINESSFIDVKVTGTTKEQLNKMIFELPALLLELHALLREPNIYHEKHKMWASDFEKLNMSPFLREVADDKLKIFYSPNESYSRDPDMFRVKDLEKILDNVGAMIPFDFGANVMATHLFWASAGKVQPLTRSEQSLTMKQKTEEFHHVFISSAEERTSFISMEVEDAKLNEKWLSSYVTPFNQRFFKLADQLVSDFKIRDGSIYGMTANKNTGFNYEKTLISYFNVLTVLDNPGILSTIKNIMKKK